MAGPNAPVFQLAVSRFPAEPGVLSPAAKRKDEVVRCGVHSSDVSASRTHWTGRVGDEGACLFASSNTSFFGIGAGAALGAGGAHRTRRNTRTHAIGNVKLKAFGAAVARAPGLPGLQDVARWATTGRSSAVHGP